MATFTLAEAQNLGLNDLQAGIAETIVTVAPAFATIPFTQVAGNAFTFNRELTLVTGEKVAGDGTITDSTAMTNTPCMVQLTGISGQSDINKQILAQQIGVNGGNDVRALHLASAAKGVARTYMNWLINGTYAGNGWDGLDAIVNGTGFSAQVEDAANAAFDLGLIDAALGRCLVKPTWIMGNVKAENAFKAKLRLAGGITSTEINGKYFMSYDDIIFIRNDYIPVDNVSGTAGNQTNIYCGSWDDGSSSGGLTGLTTFGDIFHVDEIPALQDKNALRMRVVMYGGAAVFSPVTVSVLKNITV